MTLSFVKILRPLIMTMSLVLSLSEVSAQSQKTNHKKAITFFSKAKEYFQRDNVKSLENVNKALKYDERYTDALLLKAELCLEMNDDSMALCSYERLFEIDSTAYPRGAMSLSRLYAKYHQFDKSINILEWYLSLDNQKETVREYAEKQLMLTRFRKSLVGNPVDYNPKNIGNIVNTADDEYVNQIYHAENKLIFTKRYNSETKSYLEENVFVSNMYDSLWSIPRLLFDAIDDVGAANISSDGKELYFSGCGWADGAGSCDIYLMRFINGTWSNPINITAINTPDWESQPCVSFDGGSLYFVRRNKRTGTSDIYVSHRNENGNWDSPHKLNSNINTEGNEMAPFIHYDDMTLYFSSDTHDGMGGYDLFISRRDERGEWGKPINLGYPLNTDGDEMNLVVASDAKSAYISAKRDDGYGAYDIYSFDLDERFRPHYIENEAVSDYDYALNNDVSVILKDINFEFDSAELTQDSYEGISRLIDFLVSHDDVNIELSGHTDDMGDAEYNISLSERRAESVRRALVEGGVSLERIIIKGCGATQPLFPNDSDRHRALNRRVEMRFVNL